MKTLVGLPQIKAAQTDAEDLHSMDYALTRQDFVNVIERVLTIMGAHFHDYEQQRLREFARDAKLVSFGTWALKPGCPLQQTGMCTSSDRQDSVHELFVEHFDAEMRKIWGAGSHAQALVTIL